MPKANGGNKGVTAEKSAVAKSISKPRKTAGESMKALREAKHQAEL